MFGSVTIYALLSLLTWPFPPLALTVLSASGRASTSGCWARCAGCVTGSRGASTCRVTVPPWCSPNISPAGRLLPSNKFFRRRCGCSSGNCCWYRSSAGAGAARSDCHRSRCRAQGGTADYRAGAAAARERPLGGGVPRGYAHGGRSASPLRHRWRGAAAGTGHPVVPVAHNAGHYWPRRGFLKKPGTIHVVIGPVIESAARQRSRSTAWRDLDQRDHGQTRDRSRRTVLISRDWA